MRDKLQILAIIMTVALLLAAPFFPDEELPDPDEPTPQESALYSILDAEQDLDIDFEDALGVLEAYAFRETGDYLDVTEDEYRLAESQLRQYYYYVYRTAAIALD